MSMIGVTLIRCIRVHSFQDLTIPCSGTYVFEKFWIVSGRVSVT